MPKTPPFVSIFKTITNRVRRMVTGRPSSITPEADVAWTSEQVKVYATQQPYSSPLTTPTGGFGAGETWEMRRAFREMAIREPAVKSALLTKCLAVAQLDPQMIPGKKRDKTSREVANYVDWAVTSSKGGWPGLILKMLLPGLVDGFSVVEPVWHTVDPFSGDYPGKWAVKEFKDKDTEFIRFRLDTFRNITAVQSYSGSQGGFSFDPKDFLIFSHLSIFCNPFGVSDLRAAFRAASLIEGAIKLRAILLTNFSGPYIVAKAKDPTVRNQCAKLLSQARARGWIVVPDNAEIELLNLATSAPDQFQTTIKDYREEIVTAIQGAYLQLLEGGVSNSRGNTQVHESVAQLFQYFLANEVCEVINHQLIPDLVYPNFGRNVSLPRASLGGIDPTAVVAAMGKFREGQALGLPLSKNQIYDEGYLEVPADANDTLEPPQQQQQQGGPGGGGDPAGGWAPYRNPDDGRGGNISPGGRIKYNADGKGGAVEMTDSFPHSRAIKLIGQENIRRVSGGGG